MDPNPNLGVTALMIYLNWMSTGGIQRIMWARWERLVKIALRWLAQIRRQFVFDGYLYGWDLRKRGNSD